MKKFLYALLMTAIVFAVVFLGRGKLSSAFASVTLQLQDKSDEEMRMLSEKYEKAVMRLEKNKILEDENKKLKSLLSVKSDADISVVTAKVISFGNNTDYRYLFADCGKSDGVQPGSCVISESGYVGDVYECGENWCGIKTLEAGSEMSVTCLGNGKTYLLSGKGKKLKFVSMSDDISPGDMIVTSGLSDTVPKGLKVGRVMKSENESRGEVNVTVSCFADYKNLSYVLICTGGVGSE